MTVIEVVDLSSDDELGEVDVKPVVQPVKLEPGLVSRQLRQNENHKGPSVNCQTSKTQCVVRGSEEIRSSNALSTGHSSSSVIEQGQSPVNDTGLSSTSAICPPPVTRQFWKAGNYDDGIGSKVKIQNGNNYLHVHPMFLHSNATSHKWAFGAVAELLDNAVDEIQNGATFVVIDKISNPRDGSPALLIQDNGSGMDPEAMRRCMSFGFSDKKSKSSIGQYGNGFKTSTMRLGGDVIVFSRHQDKSTLTQSIGLLSYTFLVRTGHDRIVVPMVDYKFNTSTQRLDILNGQDHFLSNLSLMLQWSPYSTEADLLKQFNDIGSHGTKVMIYNLWFTDDGNVELDFDTDLADIRISGDTKKVPAVNKTLKKLNEEHIANRYQYSLRVYLSILYLRIPETFQIVLRGRVVEHHNIANDLKFPEFILYKPQLGGSVEAQVITTIGFLKEAPHVSFHGFNVYHKNRLILPYWHVVSYFDNRGRGVVGVLEANFVEPSHNKQDFEKTSLFQKLESRLKEMTWEYWDYHCGLIGYQVKRKLAPEVSSGRTTFSGVQQPVTLGQSSPEFARRSEQAVLSTPSRYEQGRMKRKEHGDTLPVDNVKVAKVTDTRTFENVQWKDREAVNLMQENRKLRAKCLEFEKTEKELNFKVTQLRSELKALDDEYSRMMAELESLEGAKEENGV